MPAKVREKAQPPSDVLRRRIREVRERRGWSQQDLADRLTEMGAPTDRTVIARTETGTRGVGLDEALIYIAALGAQPANMLVSPSGEPVLIGNRAMKAAHARRWLFGRQLLDGHTDADKLVFYSEVPLDEIPLLEEHELLSILVRVPAIVDAMAARDWSEANTELEHLAQVVELLRGRLTRRIAKEGRRGAR